MSDGVWLVLARGAGRVGSLTQQQAVEEALRWGWIDGQAKGVDESSWSQRFTPRRRRSLWSARNRERALALIASGRMQPAGLREVERARADGRWDAAYEPPSRSSVPDDLAAALARSKKAAAFFANLDSRNRYAVLFRIHTAKKAETRAARIAAFVGMLKKGEKIYP